MASLNGKVVIITGASSGFGAAAATLFAREGCKVVLAARRMVRLEQLAREIKAGGGQALPVAMDVTQPAQIEAMVAAALDVFGQVDILFNNAGFGRLDSLEALDPIKDIQAQVTVDLLGVILTARAVLPHMYARRSGHIINMSSMAGWMAPPLYSVYSAGKFGVRGFSEALRREAAGMGVRVSVIYPGSAATEFGSHIGASTSSGRIRLPSSFRLSSEDVAQAVVGLAKHPRRELVMPWIMVVIKFFNSHFNGLSDLIQSRTFKRNT